MGRLPDTDTSLTTAYFDTATFSVSTSIWAQTFSYDQYNNLTKSGSLSWIPGYNSANNRYTLAGTTYDSNGNLLTDTFHTYTWNEFNRMKTVDSSTCGTNGQCITYDALGRAVEVSNGSAYTQIWYTQLGKTAYMNGGTYAYAYWPTPGGGTLLKTSSGFQYQHKDWLGNARISSTVTSETIIDDRAFAPYGEMYNNFGSTSANELMFTGDTQDVVAGIYNTPNRELHPNQGRWLSPDPAGAGWNLYAYGTNPNNGTDPTGLGMGVKKEPPGCNGRNGCGGGGGSGGLFAGWDSLQLLAFFTSVGSNSGSVGADAGSSAGSGSVAGPPDVSNLPVVSPDWQAAMDAANPDTWPPVDQSLMSSILGLPTGTGDPAGIAIGGLLFSFHMQNGYIDENGVQQTVFPDFPADSQVIGNAWNLQVVNGSGQPLAGNFSVTEDVTVLASTGNSSSIHFPWTTNSTGGFVDNIFFAFDSPFNSSSIAAFLTRQSFTINGAGANSFNQYYNYYDGLQFAYPLPTGNTGP